MILDYFQRNSTWKELGKLWVNDEEREMKKINWKNLQYHKPSLNQYTLPSYFWNSFNSNSLFNSCCLI